MCKRLAFCVAILVLGLISATAYAEQDQVKRTLLQKIEVPGTQYVAIMGIAEVEPGGIANRHTHPGVETAYIAEGEGVLIIEGKPDRQMKVGDSFTTTPGVPHYLRNLSKSKPLKILTVWIVEKDKPPVIPAPK
jgi:quercetin dioxygenase-like cupin family protein